MKIFLYVDSTDVLVLVFTATLRADSSAVHDHHFPAHCDSICDGFCSSWWIFRGECFAMCFVTCWYTIQTCSVFFWVNNVLIYS